MSESANNFNKRNRNITPQLDCVLDCLCCISIKGSNIYKGILKATDSKKWLLFYMALKYLWKVNILKKKKVKKKIVAQKQTLLLCSVYMYIVFILETLWDGNLRAENIWVPGNFIKFCCSPKLPDNHMAHSQTLRMLSLRIPAILAGRGDSKTKAVWKMKNMP